MRVFDEQPKPAKSCDHDTEAPTNSTGRHRYSSTRKSKLFSFAGKHDKHTETVFNERYTLGGVIGYGAFGTVRVAVDRVTGKSWACKTVAAGQACDREARLREVDILQQLDHPHLVKFREYFDTPRSLYIITELLEGTDLLHAVLERGSYSEDDARDIILQVLSALSYLDSKGVAHRDIKLENIMLTTTTNCTQIKIIDFGLADQLLNDRKGSPSAFKGACGTPTYVAPEVASSVPYGTGCDVWAAGIILFTLLSGDYPFQGNSTRDVLNKVRRAKLRFTDPVWEITSYGAKSLVQKLLTVNSGVRITASEALAHSWLTK
jgi:serine/threonine protein kinase